MRKSSAIAVLAVAAGASTSLAQLQLVQLGEAAPPGDIAGVGVIPFGPDPRATFADETFVETPVGGQVDFSIPLSHRVIGGGWGSWSHGYRGDVYYTNGAASVSTRWPTPEAMYLYAEPNPFALIEFEITGFGGGASQAVIESINGSSGAKGYGFANPGGSVDSVEVRTTDGVTDFAIGEFGIAGEAPPVCPKCLADCDESGSLDFFDFLCFQNLFGSGSICADCDGSGDLDFFDFLCFQNEFATGCPVAVIEELGTEAPPGVLCGSEMTPFPPDPRPTFADETTVPSPLGGDVVFSTPCSHRVIGGGWGTWSHGYTGDVYYTNGASSLDIGVPGGNTAFYFYVEPNPFALIEFEISTAAGSVVDSINGSSGAKGFGFCDGVDSINVRTTDGVTDFAVGEFGIAN